MKLFGAEKKLGVAFRQGRYDLPLNKDEGTNFLRLLIALMSFLAAVALAGNFALNSMTQRWSSGLENKLTIEIARTFNLAEAATAQHFLEQNHPIGKLVLTLG